MQSLRASAFAIALLLAGCGGDDDAPPPPPLVDCGVAVAAGGGDVAGVRDVDGACAYRGIPFAASTAGANRWRPPQPPPPWSGVRVANRYGPQCPQEIAGLGLGEIPGWGDEDCLSLNVWRPAAVAAPRPVMVFIHGGAFVIGAGSWPQYEGGYLAQHDVVVVTINYRLGPLGFLASSDLRDEPQSDASLEGTFGNWGILDQIAALEWVRDHIAGFGGDPDNVTIFGESAGGMSVCTLLASPRADGLFHRAIIESGGCTAVGLEAKGFARGVSYAAAAGCAAAPDRLACLRAIDADELFDRVLVDAIADGWQPHVDGVVLNAVPLVTLQTGQSARVPLIAGSNRDEVRPTAYYPPVLDWADRPWSEFWQRVGEIYGADAVPEMQRVYPQSQYDTPVDVLAAMQSDLMLSCPTQIAAREHARFAPAFHYMFAWDEAPLARHFGAFHAFELPFVFATFEAWNPLYGKDLAAVKGLAAKVQGYWTRFALSGDPNGGEVAWPGYEDRATLVIDEPLSVVQDLRRDRCAFWEPRIPVGLEELTANVVSLGD